MHRAPHIRIFPLAILSSVLACSSAPESPPSKGSGGPSGPTVAAPAAADRSLHAASLDTGVPGEQFASLDLLADKLSGVFVKDGLSLAFEVQHAVGASALRLSTASGEALYWQVQEPSGVEMRVGSTYRSVLPVAPGAVPPSHPTYSPEGFESSGDLKAAFEALKVTPAALLPHLSAALGRVGLTGARSPMAMAVHATAMQLTRALGLDIDRDVRTATNQWIAAAALRAAAPSGLSGAVPKPVTGVRTEGFVMTAPPVCPQGRAPCKPPAVAATSGLFAGCCLTPPPVVLPRDYSNTSYCHSGVGREALQGLVDNPCHDDCLGMCGPGCDPWDWVCGDESVHTACWRHDSVSSCDWWDAFCWARYGAYTSWIFTDTQALGLCENTVATDDATDPFWWGLWASHPGYFDYDPNN